MSEAVSRLGKDGIMTGLFFSSTLMWNGTLEQMFRMAAEHGLQGMEVWAQHFEAKAFSVDEYLRLSRLYGMETIVHAPSWDINLASMSDKIRRGSLKETKRAVDFALRMGSCELTVHPGHASLPVEKEASYDRLFDSLCELYEYAFPKGATISLEVMEKLPVMLADSAENMKRATRALFGRFAYTVDSAHCDSEEEVFSLLRTLPSVSKIHISNRSGQKLHTPLFRGDYDFVRLLPKLWAIGIPLVIEGMDFDQDFSFLKSTLSFVENVVKNSRCTAEIKSGNKAACM